MGVVMTCCVVSLGLSLAVREMGVVVPFPLLKAGVRGALGRLKRVDARLVPGEGPGSGPG